VYLWIKDDVVELRDAGHVWGQPTKETEEMIREELGDKRIRLAMIGLAGMIREELGDKRIRLAMIGLAGEKMVRYACIMNGLKDAAGRTGLGAVMGSKKLKAIAVRGTKPLPGADPEKIREIAREMARDVQSGKKAAGMHDYGTGRGLAGMVLTGNLPIRNFQDGEFAGATKLSAENYMEEIGTGMEGCYACAVRCKKVVRVDAPYKVDPAYGGPEYESAGALGSCCGVDDIALVSKATELCNAYSLDTIGTGVTIAFAMECFEKGLLTLEDTGGLDLRFGNGDAVVQMVEKIAHREGLGDLLAEGTESAAASIGQGAERFDMAVKGQAYPMHEPRFKRALAISYAVSPTGADHHCHALHDTALVDPGDDILLIHGTLESMGVLELMPLESLGPEKVRATLYSTISQVMSNCLPTCMFVPWTGWDVSAYELMKVGERALTLARVYNVREGFGIDDDRLSERSYGPTRDGALADGGIDHKALREAVHTYYAMAGWDRETGVPLVEKLGELDVSWAAEYLPG